MHHLGSGGLWITCNPIGLMDACHGHGGHAPTDVAGLTIAAPHAASLREA